MSFTQPELDIINQARQILKEKLAVEAEQILGKFTQPKKREVLEMLKLLDLETWDLKVKARVEGYIRYLTQLWSVRNESD